MQIITNNICKPSFQRVHTSENLKKIIKDKKGCPKKFINNFIYARYLYKKAKISNTKNIDLELDYEQTKGFYLYIVSKKYKGRHEILSKEENQYFGNLNVSDERIKQLKEWTEYWDNYYKDKV